MVSTWKMASKKPAMGPNKINKLMFQPGVSFIPRLSRIWFRGIERAIDAQYIFSKREMQMM